MRARGDRHLDILTDGHRPDRFRPPTTHPSRILAIQWPTIGSTPEAGPGIAPAIRRGHRASPIRFTRSGRTTYHGSRPPARHPVRSSIAPDAMRLGRAGWALDSRLLASAPGRPGGRRAAGRAPGQGRLGHGTDTVGARSTMPDARRASPSNAEARNPHRSPGPARWPTARPGSAPVQDYTCTFFKRERIDGKLSDANVMAMKARTHPSERLLQVRLSPTPAAR